MGSWRHGCGHCLLRCDKMGSRPAFLWRSVDSICRGDSMCSLYFFNLIFFHVFPFNLERWLDISSALRAGVSGSCLTQEAADRGEAATGSVGISTCGSGHSDPSGPGVIETCSQNDLPGLVTLRLSEPGNRHQFDKSTPTWMQENHTNVCWNVFRD